MTPLQWVLTSLLLVAVPFGLSMLGMGIARLKGTRLDAAAADPCFVFGVDISGLLYNLFMCYWLGEPLNNSLRAQRDLERAAVVSCLEGKGGSLFKRQGAADVRSRPRPPGLSCWPALVVALFRWMDIHLQKRA